MKAIVTKSNCCVGKVFPWLYFGRDRACMATAICRRFRREGTGWSQRGANSVALPLTTLSSLSPANVTLRVVSERDVQGFFLNCCAALFSRRSIIKMLHQLLCSSVMKF
jgi:hypothetical protein